MNTILVLMTVAWLSHGSNNDTLAGGFSVLTTEAACKFAVDQTQRAKTRHVSISCAPYDGKAAEVVKP